MSEIHASTHRHPEEGGWLRPAVFGAMDGLVSNFALIMGVFGGTAAAAGMSGSLCSRLRPLRQFCNMRTVRLVTVATQCASA